MYKELHDYIMCSIKKQFPLCFNVYLNAIFIELLKYIWVQMMYVYITADNIFLLYDIHRIKPLYKRDQHLLFTVKTSVWHDNIDIL